MYFLVNSVDAPRGGDGDDPRAERLLSSLSRARLLCADARAAGHVGALLAEGIDIGSRVAGAPLLLGLPGPHEGAVWIETSLGPEVREFLAGTSLYDQKAGVLFVPEGDGGHAYVALGADRRYAWFLPGSAAWHTSSGAALLGRWEASEEPNAADLANSLLKGASAILRAISYGWLTVTPAPSLAAENKRRVGNGRPALRACELLVPASVSVNEADPSGWYGICNPETGHYETFPVTTVPAALRQHYEATCAEFIANVRQGVEHDAS